MEAFDDSLKLHLATCQVRCGRQPFDVVGFQGRRFICAEKGVIGVMPLTSAYVSRPLRRWSSMSFAVRPYLAPVVTSSGAIRLLMTSLDSSGDGRQVAAVIESAELVSRSPVCSPISSTRTVLTPWQERDDHQPARGRDTVLERVNLVKRLSAFLALNRRGACGCGTAPFGPEQLRAISPSPNLSLNHSLSAN